MTEHKIVVDTHSRRGLIYKICEYGPQDFHIQRVHIRLIFNDYDGIGTADSLEHAVTLIKADVGEAVTKLDIRAW